MAANLFLSYNTTDAVETRVSPKMARSEAMWNLAAWQTEEMASIDAVRRAGHWRDDREGKLILASWLRDVEHESAAYETVPRVLTALSIDVGMELHRSGLLLKAFGKDIPVIVHDDDYGESMVANTKLANPSVDLTDFLAWMGENGIPT